MSRTFLSSAELRELTGTAVKADQIAYLKEKNIRHWGPNRAGKITVPRSAIDGQPPAPTDAPAWSPDFSSVRA